MTKLNNNSSQVHEQTYIVKGMHCASCEIIIEKKLLELEGVLSVEASSGSGEATIEYEGEKPALQKLNKLFANEKYFFSDQPENSKPVSQNNDFWKIFGIFCLILGGFYALNKLGLSDLINLDSNSTLPLFFLFGLLAGISSCAALVGGIILSLSKQWYESYSVHDSFSKKIQPHLLFNLGRIISYGLLGAVLGAIGGKLQLSPSIGAFLIIVVSIIMFFLGLSMVGIKGTQNFQIALPKFITRYIANESHFQGRYMPFLMGALTFFLPCGFTITAQGLALLSGNPSKGGLIMFTFALGTLIPLLIIGMSSVKFYEKPHLSEKFLKVAGLIVLFFALYNINNQLNILGMPSFSNVAQNSGQTTSGPNISDDELPPIVNGKQILKMEASSSGYNPNYLKVRANVPVIWEISVKNVSGCTNAIISRDLFTGQIELVAGKTVTKEFTPKKSGKYKFSCWMGMVSGTIEAVDQTSPASSTDNNEAAVSFGGAQGCGSCSAQRCSVNACSASE